MDRSIVSRLDMLAYVDSDHTTCLDNVCLDSGGDFYLAERSIAWFSGTQRVVVLLSFDAECIASADIVKEYT